MNLLGIYWLHYINRKAVKYAIGLSKSGSYFAVTSPNIQLLIAWFTIGIKYLFLIHLNSD
jgi:hypothetical protein